MLVLDVNNNLFPTARHFFLKAHPIAHHLSYKNCQDGVVQQQKQAKQQTKTKAQNRARNEKELIHNCSMKGWNSMIIMNFSKCDKFSIKMQIRVSSVISNSPIIMNVDCDMYSNNCDTIRDALCFFLDEEMGHKIGFVQFPQNYNNLTKNNIYGNSLHVINEVSIIKL